MGQRALDGFMALGFYDAPRVLLSILRYPPCGRQDLVRIPISNSNRHQEVTLAAFGTKNSASVMLQEALRTYPGARERRW
jgi:hypothetical protein